MEFKSNGTKAKKTPKTDPKNTGSKKKRQFFWFTWGVWHGFPRKSNEFSRKSNGEWILLGIKRGLKKKNNHMIRVVPARIETGRGK